VDAVQHETVPAYLNALDVLVLPSQAAPRWKEQFGHVLIEAMACGVSVVGSQSGAIPEVIGDAGLTFPPGDAAALGQALLRIGDDVSLRESLIRAGRARVMALYTHERIARANLDFFRQVLGS
jgi:glycosyltransferase involved in cell wall biosynthesis